MRSRSRSPRRRIFFYSEFRAKASILYGSESPMKSAPVKLKIFLVARIWSQSQSQSRQNRTIFPRAGAGAAELFHPEQGSEPEPVKFSGVGAGAVQYSHSRLRIPGSQ